MSINCWSNLGWQTKVLEGTLKHTFKINTHLKLKYLKTEHQEQIALIETKVAERMQNEIQKIQATSDQTNCKIC